MSDGWPTSWDGVAESVTTTCGPNGRWNVAALGVHAPEGGVVAGDRPADPIRARTWGRTRTWRNFTERGRGYVQFTRDPVDFVEAACSVREEPEPVLDSAAAWAAVSAEAVDSGTDGDTAWTEWALTVDEARVEAESVAVVSRGHAAVIEATVAASRLDVSGYDAETLRERIRFFESVVDAAGGERDRAAWERFDELVEWRA